MSLRTFTESDALPDRIVLYANKGWGKTTAGAQSPKPIIFMSRGETGYLTLRRNNLVPDVPFAIIDSWDKLHLELRELIVKGVGDRQTLVMDAWGGFERLCHEYICDKEFKGDWGERGFGGFKRGFERSVPEITKLCDLLDEVSRKLNLRIIILAHSRVKGFNNPLGAAFDRYIVDCHEKSWEPLNGWSDCVLFGKMGGRVAKIDGDNKGVGGDERYLYATFTDAAEAKNRHDLPHEIIMPKKASEMWNAIGPKLAAAVKVGAAKPEASKSEPVKEAKNVQEQLGNQFELVQLIEKHKLHDMMDKWKKHFKVDDLNKLSEKQVADLINKIKSTYEEVKSEK